MSDREFNEIQLSGKQLVFLFISLVVLAVVTFLLGVSVGKRVRDDVPEPPRAVAVATEAVVNEAPPVEQAPELGYHELLAGTDTPATSAPSPAAPSEEPSQELVIAPELPPPPPPKATVKPAAKTTPAAKPPAARSPASPSAAGPAAKGEWFLQFGAYSGRQPAQSQVAALKKLGVTAFVVAPVRGAPDRLYRVRVGPYRTQAAAEAVRVRLVRQGFKPRFVR